MCGLSPPSAQGPSEERERRTLCSNGKSFIQMTPSYYTSYHPTNFYTNVNLRPLLKNEPVCTFLAEQP